MSRSANAYHQAFDAASVCAHQSDSAGSVIRVGGSRRSATDRAKLHDAVSDLPLARQMLVTPVRRTSLDRNTTQMNRRDCQTASRVDQSNKISPVPCLESVVQRCGNLVMSGEPVYICSDSRTPEMLQPTPRLSQVVILNTADLSRRTQDTPTIRLYSVIASVLGQDQTLSIFVELGLPTIS